MNTARQQLHGIAAALIDRLRNYGDGGQPTRLAQFTIEQSLLNGRLTVEGGRTVAKADVHMFFLMHVRII